MTGYYNETSLAEAESTSYKFRGSSEVQTCDTVHTPTRFCLWTVLFTLNKMILRLVNTFHHFKQLKVWLSSGIQARSPCDDVHQYTEAGLRPGDGSGHVVNEANDANFLQSKTVLCSTLLFFFTCKFPPIAELLTQHDMSDMWWRSSSSRQGEDNSTATERAEGRE